MAVADSYAVVELAIGVFVLLGAIKSAYNGTINKYLIRRLRRADEAYGRVEEVDQKVDNLDQKVDEVLERQNIQTQAIVAVGMSANNGVSFDGEEYRREMGEEGADQFLQDDD